MFKLFASAPLAFATFFGLAAAAPADGDRHLKVVPSRGIGPVESVTVYQTKDGKRVAAAEVTKFAEPAFLPGEGPFEVFVKPKGGIPVRVAEKLTVKAGATHELKIGDVLGAVEVVGDDLPRADKVVLTDVKDPGPGEKGHVAIQMATDYRVDMLVPPGTYAVWVVPANGARAQRVVDNVRVQAGRSVRVGD
jgi:hypothetical protein